MQVEKLLKEIRFIDDRINSKLRQLDQLRKQIGSVKSFDYSKDRVQESNRPGSAIEDLVAKICDLEMEITKEIDRLADNKAEAMAYISEIGGVRGTVLEMRYLENMGWDKIAYTLGRSVRCIFNWHKEAIKDLEEFSNLQ